MTNTHIGEPTNPKAKWLALGGITAALGATACCILPLVLFSVGIGGAWVGTLTGLSKFQPIFVTVALVCLSVGFYWVYIKPKKQCAEGTYCASPRSNTVVKVALWCATVLIIAALLFPYVAPKFLN